MATRTTRLLLLITLLCLLAKALPAQQRPTTEDAINKALDSSVKGLEFIESPLIDVVDRLKEIYRIPIVVDERALEDSSVGTDKLITWRATDIPLRSALTLMLRQIDLRWVVCDGYLIITTRETALGDSSAPAISTQAGVEHHWKARRRSRMTPPANFLRTRSTHVNARPTRQSKRPHRNVLRTQR